MRAFTEHLTFGGMTAPGVVVECDTPWRYVFWAGAQYVGCVDLGGGVWFTPEWFETNSPEDLHCYEPIMDKALRWTHAEIVAAGPARAVVKWRYALNDMRYRIFHGNTTAEETYTIYPDGLAVRKLIGWPGDATDQGGNPNFWQVMEYILINGPATRPETVLNPRRAFSFGNARGDELGFGWPLPPERFALCRRHPGVAHWDRFAGRLHLPGRPDPFVAFPGYQSLFPHLSCPDCGGDHPWFGMFAAGSTFSHWPANPCEDFVLAVAADDDEIGRVATHTSIMDCNAYSVPGLTPPRPTSWLFLLGALQGEAEGLGDELPALMDSWLMPARIRTGNEREGRTGIEGMAQGDYLYEGYAFSERAYQFRQIRGGALRFTVEPRVPISRPVFVVNGFSGASVELTLDGQRLGPDAYRWQRDGDDVVIWVDATIDSVAEVELGAGA